MNTSKNNIKHITYIILSLITAISMVLALAPLAKAEGGVAAAFSDGKYRGVGSAANISMKFGVFSSGDDWKYDPNNPDAHSPAWQDFVKTVKVNRNPSEPGDYYNGKAYNTQRWLKEDATGFEEAKCQRSSYIWINYDAASSSPGRININLDTPNNTLSPLNGSPEKIMALLTTSTANTLNPDKKSTRKIADIARQAANEPVMVNGELQKLKVLCSYQIAPNIETDEPVYECKPGDPNCERKDICIEGTGDPNCPPAFRDPPSNRCTSDWKTGNAIDFQKAITEVSRRVGFEDIIRGSLQVLGNIAAPIGEATALFLSGDLIESSKKIEDINIDTYKYRCIDRYITWYKAAPANYRTEFEFAKIKDSGTGDEYDSIAQFKQREYIKAGNKKSGSNVAPIVEMDTNSPVAQMWWKAMQVAELYSTVSTSAKKWTDVDDNGRPRMTDFGKIWMQDYNLRGDHTMRAFFNKTIEIKDAAERDKTAENKKFSQGRNIPATKQAILAMGGVLNIKELEQYKIVRITQHYHEIQVGKCRNRKMVKLDAGLIRDKERCNPDISRKITLQPRDYKKEAPNLGRLNAMQLSADQAKIMAAKVNNAGRNPMSVSPLDSATGVATALKNNSVEGLGKCFRDTPRRVSFMLESSGNDIKKVPLKWMNDSTIRNVANIATLARNIGSIPEYALIPCQQALEAFNPAFDPAIEKLSDEAELQSLIQEKLDNRWGSKQSQQIVTLNIIPKDEAPVVQKASFIPQVSAWWQILSVNCNKSGFFSEVVKNNATVISNSFQDINGESHLTPVGDTFHGVARTDVTTVDYNNPSTNYVPRNYKFAKQGLNPADSYYVGFYDKECPFECTSRNSKVFGASENNDAINNVDNDDKGGAQMLMNQRAPYNSKVSPEDVYSSQLFNIFRDNVWKNVRINVWYPTNSAGSTVDQTEQSIENIKNAVRGQSSPDMIYNELLKNPAQFAARHNDGGGSLGILYDKSAPISTTITRYKYGTPSNFDMYRTRAIPGAFGSTQNLSKEQTSYVDIFLPNGASGKDIVKGSQVSSIETQKSLSLDLPRFTNSDGSKSIPANGVGNETAHIFKGLVNGLSVRSSWASDKGLPQVYNFKWEYHTPSVFVSASHAGFNRDATNENLEQANVRHAYNKGATMTILEGKCQAMFNSLTGLDTIALFNQYTGTGSANKLDNNENGTLSGRGDINDRENLLINSVRDTGE